MKQYEAMFVFDPTFGSSFDACDGEVRRLMDRAEGELLICRKWDERRLAYRINGRKRGVYVLTYFKAPPDNIKSLERDAKLSEHILRLLVLNADEVSRDTMERAFTQRTSDADRPEGSRGASATPAQATAPAATPATGAATATVEAPKDTTAEKPSVPETTTPAPEKADEPAAETTSEGEASAKDE